MGERTRAAIYRRVSTDDQANPDKTSLAQQRERCEAYCQAQDWEVAGVYEDAGVSGAEASRPALDALLVDAGAGRFQRIVFLKLDRLGRSVRALANLSHQLDEHGVGIVSVQDNFDTGTISGRLYFNILGAIAEFERDLITERMASGRQGRVRNGKYQVGDPPYGYEYDKEAGQLEPHEGEAEVVRKIFRLAAHDGAGIQAIAQQLNSDGVPPPGVRRGRRSRWGWQTGTVHKLLTARRYVGENTYGKDAIPMGCPPLVEPATFNAARQALKRRKRTARRNTKRTYLLQHLVYCRRCGSLYSPETAATGHSYYRCRQRRKHGPAAGHEGFRWAWPVRELDLLVKRWLLKLMASPEESLRQAELYVEQAGESREERAERERKLLDAVDASQEEEQRVITAWRKEFIDEAAMVAQLDQVRAERKEAEAGLAELRPRLDLDDEEAEAIEWEADVNSQTFQDLLEGEMFRSLRGLSPDVPDERIDEVLAAHADDDPEEWRDAAQSLVRKVWVEEDGSLTIEGAFEAGVTAPTRS